MSKAFKENYFTRQNGCRLEAVSSQLDGTTAANILVDNPKALWVTDRPLPQYCIIDTSDLKKYPRLFNRVGFYCWHQYQTNPSLIEIAYNNGKDEEWIVVGKVRLSLTDEHQYFKIKDIPASEMKQVKITLIENNGDEKQTYINQVLLGFVKEESTSVNASRQKTYSQFIKLTSTEKQLKKSQQQINRISSQQQELRQTVKQQNQVILKMQDAIKKLTKHIQKMHEMQQIQNKKIIMLENGREKVKVKYTRQNTRLGSRQAQLLSDKSERDSSQKRYIEDTLISKKTLNLLNSNNHSYAKSQRQSHKQPKQTNFKQNKNILKNITLLKSRQAKHLSDSDLSEFNASQDQQSKYSDKCTMMKRLQLLITQRQKRQRELKKKSINGQ